MESTLERVRSRGTHIVHAPATDDAPARSALELIARALLVGIGIGAILTAGAHNQLLIVIFAGVLAIGAAIAELGA